MIIFVTNRKHDVVPNNELKIVSETAGREEYTKLSSEKLLGIDTENTGLDPYYSQPLLVSLGTKDLQFVIDSTSVDAAWFILKYNKTVQWLGHNLKYDYSIIKVQYKVELEDLYDTMIAEQCLYPNYFDLKTKPFSLLSVTQRNLGYVPAHMIKEVRKEFVGVPASSFLFSNRHITYSAADIAPLFDIKAYQEKVIAKYKMDFLVRELEFPLIKIIAEMELEGLDIDEEALLKLVEANKQKQHEKLLKLDEIFQELRDTYAEDGDRAFITSGKYDAARSAPRDYNFTTLFGDTVDAATVDYSKKTRKTGIKPKKPKKTKGPGVNYGSTAEVIRIFSRLNFPVPTKKGKYIVPILDDKNKVVNSYEEFTTNEDALQQYIIAHPNSPSRAFIEALLEYREVTTELNKYGKDFLLKKNHVTGRIHTLFRQRDAVNGRLQSGGRREQTDRINVQNVPRKKEFRQLFYRKGYSIVTCDLAGAEVTVMADKAKDQKLFDLAMKGDIHSYMATKGWRNIFRYRRSPEAETYIVSKVINPEVRQSCKNLTFAVVYRVHAKKAGQTINVSPQEGQIYIDTVKREIPSTIAMVENNIDKAFRFGYLVLNTRTNSRVWFPAVAQAYRERRQLEFMEAHDIEGQAANVPISGTQADMVKEAMVELTRYFKENNIDAAILIQVHDELVVRVPQDRAEELKEVIKDIMCMAANRYLSLIKMGAEAVVKPTWTK